MTTNTSGRRTSVGRRLPAAITLAIWFALGVPAALSAAPEKDPASSPADTLHLLTNQSFLVNTKSRVKRVAVAKPEIADVIVVRPTQLMVTGKASGETTLIYWSEAEDPTSLSLSVETNVDRVREELHRVAPGESFEVLGTADGLVLTGTVSTGAIKVRLGEAAKVYAKNVANLLKVAHLDQVLIQVKVAEVDRSVAKELGFNFLVEQNKIRGALSPPNSFTPFFGNLRDSQPRDIGPNTSFSDAMNLFVAKPGQFPKFAAFLRALHDRGAMKVLAEPNMVVADGAEGKFLAGGEFPIVYNTTAGGTSSFSVVYKEFGIRLNFQPRIADNGEIYMKVAQEVSDLDFANAVVLSGFRIPALRSRRAESGLQLADGQSFVIAGLIDNRISKQVSKFPLLGDIPVLGALFRSTRFSNDETELMVLVTPRLAKPLAAAEVPSLPTDRIKPGEVSPDMLR